MKNWNTIKFIKKENNSYIWGNDEYIVVVRDHPGYTHLSFHNKERSINIPWWHKQQIKNDICGENRWGVEVFPPQKDVFDNANQYHLWVLQEGIEFPFKT